MAGRACASVFEMNHSRFPGVFTEANEGNEELARSSLPSLPSLPSVTST
jgi:hypothetical protein